MLFVHEELDVERVEENSELVEKQSAVNKFNFHFFTVVLMFLSFTNIATIFRKRWRNRNWLTKCLR